MVPTVYRHQTVWQSEIFLLEVCPAPPARSLPTQTASQYPAMICWELRGGLPPSSRWDYTTVSVSHPTLEGWRTGGQEDSLVSWCRNKWLIYNWPDHGHWMDNWNDWYLIYRLCSVLCAVRTLEKSFIMFVSSKAIIDLRYWHLVSISTKKGEKRSRWRLVLFSRSNPPSLPLIYIEMYWPV